MVESNSLEVSKKWWHIESNQSCGQEGSVPEIEIVGLFLNEWAQIGQIYLLEEGHDQALLCRALKLSEKDHSHGVQALYVCAVFVESKKSRQQSYQLLLDKL